MIDKVYHIAIKNALKKYFKAWGEVLNQDELDRLGLWFAGGGIGPLPSGLVEKLHAAGPKAAKKVFKYQRLVTGTQKLFRR